MGAYPGWRTMTGAQRHNARAEKIWEDCRARAAQNGYRAGLAGEPAIPEPPAFAPDYTRAYDRGERERQQGEGCASQI